jgi:hypothetical protein
MAELDAPRGNAFIALSFASRTAAENPWRKDPQMTDPDFVRAASNVLDHALRDSPPLCADLRRAALFCLVSWMQQYCLGELSQAETAIIRSDDIAFAYLSKSLVPFALRSLTHQENVRRCFDGLARVVVRIISTTGWIEGPLFRIAIDEPCDYYRLTQRLPFEVVLSPGPVISDAVCIELLTIAP